MKTTLAAATAAMMLLSACSGGSVAPVTGDDPERTEWKDPQRNQVNRMETTSADFGSLTPVKYKMPIPDV